MKRAMLKFPVYLVMFSLSVLWLLPNSAMAEGDGAWTTATSPGYYFLIQEGLIQSQNHLLMTVIKPDFESAEFYWGLASASVGSMYLLKPLKADSDMMATWQFNSNTQATVTVESCSTNCLWQAGQVVTLNKVFGDMKDDAMSATRVPKTGQAICYDASGFVIDCSGTGQDGEYQLGVLPAVEVDIGIYGAYTVYGWAGIRFTDNLDGTVTDNLTGLIWLKNANCFGNRTWTNALSDSNSLANGSCSLTDSSSAGDWRLPNINELHSLVDLTKSNPALPTGHPFTGVQSYYYWSSTTYESFPNYAWDVDMSSGYVDNTFKDGYSHYVWPVRGGQ